MPASNDKRSLARKASDEEILGAYSEHGSVWKAADALGMCGQSVHERLTKLGANRPMRTWGASEDERLRRDYPAYRRIGKVKRLAELMGRSTRALNVRACRLGIGDRNGWNKRPGFWKDMSDDAARELFDKFKSTRFTLGQFCKRYSFGETGLWKKMSTLWPGEWEHVIESKTPQQTHYRRGRQFEYRVRNHYREFGFFVLRSPRSGSPTDLVAIRKGEVHFIQCKVGGAFPPAEWNEFLELAESTGAVPVFAERSDGMTTRLWLLTGRKQVGKRMRQPMKPFQLELVA